MRVAFDNGNVLCEADPDYKLKIDLSHKQPLEGAFDVVGRSVAKYGASNNWVISKCGDRMQRLSTQWFEQKNFFEHTGLGEQISCYTLPKDCATRDRTALRIQLLAHRIIYCYQRLDKSVIAELIDLEVMVDDRLDILVAMPPSVHTRILFRPNEGDAQWWKAQFSNDSRYHLVTDWNDVATLLEV